eukprot:CAMPEP_0119038118 /NCGR_PEP_ID=MMETSP1177-20130426/6831_1 /TAXON_ID=2985 /ORGANISM="Ochromonas sp, Strain CCMP1899" /LENGTH=30 /DNA_ID= /DNA_START= /DNA_END= /DNA_ORIENTATION=
MPVKEIMDEIMDDYSKYASEGEVICRTGIF